jgi:hypothetical protein
MTSGSARRNSEIELLLLEFQRTPGKFSPAGKQPRLLFSSIKEVLQLAGGRVPSSGAERVPLPAARQAARFFIRSALLYPDADHYSLLGLDHDVDEAGLKERYRQMMRLMHPDFSGSGTSVHWPEDAASRLNRAYEVLSSPLKRRQYDEEVNPTKLLAQAAPDLRSHSARATAAKPPAADPRHRLKQLATVFGITGGVAILASFYAGSPTDLEMLVQRAPPDVLPTAPAPVEIPNPVALPANVAIDSAPPVEPTPALVIGHQAPTPIQTTTMLPAPPAPGAVLVTQAQSQSVQFSMQAPAASEPLKGPIVLPAMAQPPATPGITIDEVHPLLSKLLQQIESGWGDRLLAQLDREARSAPATQALLSHYNALVEGMRPVRISSVQFKSEPRDSRLRVTGRVLMHLRDAPAGAPPKPLALVVEFETRNGTVVMSRLARGED